ncbi:GntR family transcriptional regulator [Piscinibacterium candidicorallinum]|uniref:GntR family transcriptional regulator n=1 Tax=Piscinibacterium candidicorallinum TaxID=1793872 RepID=A0ABV7H7Z1_9BURK
MPPRPGISASALFSVNTGAGEPIYRQLMDQVRRLIAAGQLVPGDSLPSVRDVAETFAVNPMTVSKAYSLLEAAGVLARQRGLGMVVAQGTATAQGMDSRLNLLQPTLEKAALEAAQLEIPAEEALALFARLLKEGRSE